VIQQTVYKTDVLNDDKEINIEHNFWGPRISERTILR